MNPRRDTNVLTTGQVAKICHVAPRTVSKWVDTGLLRGYRIPGGGDRRVLRDELAWFIEQHGMPREWLKDLDPPEPAASSTGGTAA